MGVSETEKFSFIYNSYKADVRFDVINDVPGASPSFFLKVSEDDRYPIKFAFQYGQGLIRVDRSVNKKKSANILGDFLRIPYDNANAYLDFFIEHGFLFRINSNQFLKVNLDDVISISKRIKALIDLINLVNAGDVSWHLKEIFDVCIAMLYDNRWSLRLSDSLVKDAPQNVIKTLIDDHDLMGLETISKTEEIQKGAFSIKDTIYTKYSLKSKDYRDIVNGCSERPGGNDTNFALITFAYANCFNVDEKTRKIVDCIFHYCDEVGIPKNPAIGEPVVYYKEPDKDSFIDPKFKQPILAMAKYIIKNEIDWMIKDIKPVYNESTMEPDWFVDSLLSAMYFSIFFMDSKMEMFKRCKYCGRLFVVKRSSTNHLYCDSYCRNNAQQAKYRAAHKKTI